MPHTPERDFPRGDGGEPDSILSHLDLRSHQVEQCSPLRKPTHERTDLMLNDNRTASLLVVAATTLIGATSGSLGGASFALVGAAAGALWGLGLAVVASRLTRSPARRRRWANGTLFASAVIGGLITGVGFLSLLMQNAALSSQPEPFAAMIRGAVGSAEALPFYLFNTPLEWILIPGALLLTWSVPEVRRLTLVALVVWTAHRVWTYVHFVPLIIEWSEAAAPMTPGELDQARTWVNLSWIRNGADLATLILVLLAGFRHAGTSSHVVPGINRTQSVARS